MKKVYMLVETEITYEAAENIIAVFDFKPNLKELTISLSNYMTGGNGINEEYYKVLHESAEMYAHGVLTGGFSDQSFSYTLEEMELVTKGDYNIVDGVYHG